MNILKQIMVIALVINLNTYGQVSSNTADTSKGWKTLAENNYSIEYPESWQLNQSGQMGTSFILLSPLSDGEDRFKENINLMVQDLTGHNLDFEKYVEISENQIKTMITDGKILKNERVTTDSPNYQKVIYTGKQGVFNLTFEQYYWVIANNAYVLTLTCEESEFDNYQATGEKILDSFKLNLN